MTGDGAVVRADEAAAKRIAGIILAATEAVKSVSDPSGVQNLARAYLELANFSEGLECNVDALIQRCQEADATIRQQAAKIEMLTLERDKFAFDRQQLWAALKAAEARTADLLKALDGAVKHWDEFGPEYGFAEVMHNARKTVAAAKGEIV